MTLPLSGPLSLKDIYSERTGFPPFSNANISLRSESFSAGFSIPDRISKFYGYSASYSVTVWLEYADAAGLGDYLTGSIRLRNAADSITLQSILIPDVAYFDYTFTGITEDCRISFDNVGITRDYMVESVGDRYWGFTYPPTNYGFTTSIITSSSEVYGELYYGSI